MQMANFTPVSTFSIRILCSFAFIISTYCLAADTIAENQKVKDGENVVSSGGIFELGFFSPNESNARFIGIWYKGAPGGKVLWVANRENPVTDLSGVLMIGGDGNLVIINGRKNTVWSTQVNFTSTTHCIAVLLDTGNLVLQENKSNGLLLWESFNHPTDTFLPHMKIGIVNRMNELLYLSSWKNTSNPSPGLLTLMMDSQEIAELIIKNGSAKIARTGQWNGRSFIGLPNMNQDYRTGFNLIVDNVQRTTYFTIGSFNRSKVLVYLSPSSQILRMEWDEERREWLKSQIAPITPCDRYNRCGPFGSCNGGKLPICECLRGYEPKSIDEWNNGNWTNGCFRSVNFKCERNSSREGKEDGFLKLTGMKLPDFSLYHIASNRIDCEAFCTKNCSCLAYAYVDGIGCMIWDEYLVDIQELPYGGVEMYLRLPYSELDGDTQTRPYVLILILVSAILSLFLMTFVSWRWRTNIGGWGKGLIKMIDLRITKTSEDSVSRYSLKDGEGRNPEIPVFSLRSIETATNNFNDANKLGEGGFGPVYKGRLPNGQDIAVKRLSSSSCQGQEEFKNEVILISKLQHRNLVRLLGCCVQGEEKLLVYEYMPNKSLDSFIFGQSNEKLILDWDKRYEIIEGIARGLLYLHRDSRLRIIHRDLKTSNILLDEELNPKISDFGLARIFGGDQTIANTKRIVGTYGYMSPEYAMQGKYSEKSDVFSFGVILLEIVSSRRNTSFDNHEDSLNLIGHAWQVWKEGKALKLLDSRLADSCNLIQVLRCVHVGLLCLQEHVDDRPTMATLVLMLSSDMIIPTPNKPAFSLNRRPDESISLYTRSSNDVTLTTMDGR